MIRGTITGILVAPVQLSRSTSGIPTAILPILVAVDCGAWELISVVVREQDLVGLPLQTWIKAEGDLRLARWQEHDGAKSQFAMRARRVEILTLPDRRRHIDDDPISDETLPVSSRISRQELN